MTVAFRLLLGIFLSTPSVGRATYKLIKSETLHFISIHALRGEGDKGPSLMSPLEVKFLSTPSVGRATRCG